MVGVGVGEGGEPVPYSGITDVWVASVTVMGLKRVNWSAVNGRVGGVGRSGKVGWRERGLLYAVKPSWVRE